MTIFSDAYLPYPYGPVPSPGTPSPKFVDLLNNQTVGGDKTLTGLSTFKAQAVFAAPAAAGAELLWQASVDDDSNASYALVNATSAANTFIPLHRYLGNNVNAAVNMVQHLHRLGAAMDSGAAAMVGNVFQNSASGQVGSRDLWEVVNGSTRVLGQNFRGALTLTQLNFSGAREVYFTINQVGLTSNGWVFDNLVSTDGELAPRLAFLATSTQPNTVDGNAPTDTGSNPVLRYNARNNTSALTARPTHAWANNNVDQLRLTAAGSLQLLTANAGLELKAGTRCRQVTLSGGTVTIADAAVTANTRCLSLVRTAKSGTLGHVDIAFTPGVGYTVTSTSGTEASIFDLVLAESL